MKLRIRFSRTILSLTESLSKIFHTGMGKILNRNSDQRCCAVATASNRESVLDQSLHSFRAVVRRMAVIAILLGISAALVQATPSIVEVRTAAPNVIVVVVQTDVTYEYGTSSVPDNVDTAAGAGHWQVNGGSPTAIHRYSIPWD